jgi:hypothetical protein
MASDPGRVKMESRAHLSATTIVQYVTLSGAAGEAKGLAMEFTHGPAFGAELLRPPRKLSGQAQNDKALKFGGGER